jgi:FdhD protein
MPLVQKNIIKIKPNSCTTVLDKIAIESPLQIEINGIPTSITMRTPGHDEALAVGFLYTEGLIQDESAVDTVVQKDENTINVLLSHDMEINISEVSKNFYTTSSCGVCGKSSIDAIHKKSKYDLSQNSTFVAAEVLYGLHEKLTHVQETFEATGGLHATALFTLDGRFLHHTEDVGRHNALDKLIGDSLLADRLPLDKHILLLSGRASFELIQKAAMAGIATVVAVGAPSSLAIELAEELGITLVGFLKKSSFNIYCGHERIHQ